MVLVAVGLPVLGAVADELNGPGTGLLFAVGAVLGTAAAVVLCSRPGRWWVVTAAPVVVLAVRAGVEYLARREDYQGKALASGALRWVVGAFPVMAEAVAAALLVIAVQTVLGRSGSRSGSRGGRGRGTGGGSGNRGGNARSRGSRRG
ncbi:DUF6542 domain-containing protein [Kitasatospora sp. NPDC092286]|uniref:DUF6542 domain-containing protein n=1 Tax=Kitasatospora sp. NPDC092286 TaxID=3364087 RepID=UPI0037FB33D3